MLTAILGAETDLCLSGGAVGADLQWGMCAGLAGHKVIHWSFAGHKTAAPAVEVVELSPEQLEKADADVAIAAKHMGRNVPTQKWIKPLIQRNWYQIAWAQSLYAVCNFERGHFPTGGTAWAIQMFFDRFKQPEGITHSPIPAYVYDQVASQWMVRAELGLPWQWIDDDEVPTPHGIWAGIGTRDLKQNGKDAIRKLMGYVKPTVIASV